MSSQIDDKTDDSSPDLSPARALEAFLEIARRRAALEEAPFWKEVSAFNQMPQFQIDQYYGQYVAVYEGNIVDADFDEAELALRFYRTWGYVPVYIHKVGTEEGLVDSEEDS
jgi:hypothetical protein